MKGRLPAMGILASMLGLLVVAPASAELESDDAVGSPLPEPAVEAPELPSTISERTLAYGGDPENEAQLVLTEERRLLDVELVAYEGLYPTLDVTQPFRVAADPVSTLVLPAREAAYTEEDLLTLAPLSFAEVGDGDYVLSEHVAILEGATLDLRRPGGMRLSLASTSTGFATIVALGGDVVIAGESNEPVQITSWDTQRGEPDLDTADGRAYVRVVGGHASVTHAELSHLGFWSGATGGFALTGTDVAGSLGVEDANGDLPEVYLDAPDDAVLPEEGASGDRVVVDSSGEQGVGLVAGAGLYSAGVTAWISGLRTDGNAYGLFVTNATSVELQNSTFMRSLVDGVVFHREVSNSRITGTESSDNAGDGFRISRGSDSVLLDTVVAANNGRNGITVDGTPLADGPSSTGLAIRSYGGHSVINSTVSSSGDYGIAVYGGDTISVRRNTVTGGRFGILSDDSGRSIDILENRVEDTAEQGIAYRDGSIGQAWGNFIAAAPIGIYVRDSQVAVVRNTIEDVTSHGVTVVGEASGTVVAQNEIDGQGNSPIDTYRAEGVSVVDSNEMSDWRYENTVERAVRTVTKPLTLLWILLGSLLLVTAFMGFRHRGSGFGSPYADRRPLRDITGAEVDPATVPGTVAAQQRATVQAGDERRVDADRHPVHV